MQNVSNLSLNMKNMDKNCPHPYMLMKTMREATTYGREDKVAVINFEEQNGWVLSRKHT